MILKVRFQLLNRAKEYATVMEEAFPPPFLRRHIMSIHTSFFAVFSHLVFALVCAVGAVFTVLTYQTGNPLFYVLCLLTGVFMGHGLAMVALKR